MVLSREVLTSRVLVIGNSGSGKSTLSRCLAARTGQCVFDLDLIHWLAGGEKRDETECRTMVAEIAARPVWIIEGVYGWLAREAVSRATAMIWTDLSWSECREGLLRRGLRQGMTDADYVALVAWAEAYWTRLSSSSFAGHMKIFDGFTGEKTRLVSRAGVCAFASGAGYMD